MDKAELLTRVVKRTVDRLNPEADDLVKRVWVPAQKPEVEGAWFPTRGELYSGEAELEDEDFYIDPKRFVGLAFISPLTESEAMKMRNGADRQMPKMNFKAGSLLFGEATSESGQLAESLSSRVTYFCDELDEYEKDLQAKMYKDSNDGCMHIHCDGKASYKARIGVRLSRGPLAVQDTLANTLYLFELLPGQGWAMSEGFGRHTWHGATGAYNGITVRIDCKRQRGDRTETIIPRSLVPDEECGGDPKSSGGDDVEDLTNQLSALMGEINPRSTRSTSSRRPLK